MIVFNVIYLVVDFTIYAVKNCKKRCKKKPKETDEEENQDV